MPPPPVVEAQQPPQPASSGSFWTNHRLHLLLILIVSMGLYANTLGHQYAVDDSIVILRNSYTQKGMKGMKGIWTEDTFTGFFGSKRNLVAGGRYRPLSVATFALELQLFGNVVTDAQGNPVLDKDGDVTYQGNPFISHLVNVLLYGILCVVLYLLLLQCFNPKRDTDQVKGYFIALAGALLYAAHPIHTEAVANIKGRDEILVLLGSLLAVYWVLRAAAKESDSVGYLVGACLAYTIAIFSKESAVTFLAIIPAALYVFTERTLRYIALRSLPYLVIFVAFFGIRSAILGNSGALISKDNAPTKELMNNPFLKWQGNQYVAFDSNERNATILYTWGKYVGLLAYPKTLTNDYYPKHIRTDKDKIPSFDMPMVMGSLLLHLALFALMLLGLYRRQAWGFFILFYLATFSVVSNLIFPIGTNMAERFMFLPSVGFSSLCALGLYAFAKRLQKPEQPLEQALSMPALLLGVVVLLYGGKTFSRNWAWYDDYTLFTTDIAYSPHSAKLNNAVSGVLQARALQIQDVFQRKISLEQALNHSTTATNLHPMYHSAWLLHGNAHIMLSENALQRSDISQVASDQQALRQQAFELTNAGLKSYAIVKELRPNHPSIHQNLGVAYRIRGKILGQYFNDLTNSIIALEQSIAYNPNDVETLRLVGVAYGIRGLQFQQVGKLEAGQGSHLKAKESFEKAASLQPNNVPVLYNLQMAYTQLGDAVKAEETRQRWLALDPNYDPSK